MRSQFCYVLILTNRLHLFSRVPALIEWNHCRNQIQEQQQIQGDASAPANPGRPIEHILEQEYSINLPVVGLNTI